MRAVTHSLSYVYDMVCQCDVWLSVRAAFRSQGQSIEKNFKTLSAGTNIDSWACDERPVFVLFFKKPPCKAVSEGGCQDIKIHMRVLVTISRYTWEWLSKYEDTHAGGC